MKKPEEAFAKRVLLSLVVDVTEMRETAERLHVQIGALAKEHGIKMPILAA
jgi:hypothetical protein